MPKAEMISRESNIARVRIEFPDAEVRQQFQLVYREYANSLSLPGFRKGKIPANVIRQRVGADSIAQAVRESMHEIAIDAAVSQLNLLPRRGRPTWSEWEPVETEAATLEVSFGVYPDITLPDYRGFEFTLPDLQVTDDMKERYYDRLRDRLTEYPEKDGPLATGDAVMGSLSSTFAESGESSPFASESVVFEIGKEGNLPGWDEQLLGKRAADSIEFDYTMPTDYDDATVAGKELKIKLDVKSVHTIAVPEFTDEYVKERFGAESLEKYDEWVMNQLQLERERYKQQIMRDMAVEKLIEGVAGEFTDDIIDESVDNIVHEQEREQREHGRTLAQSLAENGKTLEDYRASVREMALGRLKMNLAVRAIAAAENLRPTVDDFQRYAMYLAQRENITPKQFKELLQYPEFTSEMTHQIMQEKVLDHLVASAKFELAETAPTTASAPDTTPDPPAAE